MRYEKWIIPNGMSFIPKSLFESEIQAQRMIKYGPILISDPLNKFYVLVDDDNVIHGLVWLRINPVENKIEVRLQLSDENIIEITQKIIKDLRMEIAGNGGETLDEKSLWYTNEDIGEQYMNIREL